VTTTDKLLTLDHIPLLKQYVIKEIEESGISGSVRVYPTFSVFPAIGKSGLLYVAADTTAIYVFNDLNDESLVEIYGNTMGYHKLNDWQVIQGTLPSSLE